MPIQRNEAGGLQKYSPDGEAHIIASALNYKPYADATYKYYCESAGGSALTDAVWRITRVTISDGTTTYAGTVATFGAFSFAATSLAVVQALTYNNGVAL